MQHWISLTSSLPRPLKPWSSMASLAQIPFWAGTFFLLVLPPAKSILSGDAKFKATYNRSLPCLVSYNIKAFPGEITIKWQDCEDWEMVAFCWVPVIWDDQCYTLLHVSFDWVGIPDYCYTSFCIWDTRPRSTAISRLYRVTALYQRY